MTILEQTTYREDVADQRTLTLTTKSPYIIVPVKQIQITDLPSVAYVDVRADVQYENANAYNVMHSEYIAATLDGTFLATDVDHALIRPMGSNWDHADHYARATLSRIWAPSGLETSADVLTLTLVCYAASSAALTGDTVSVKYMDVQVNVFPKGAA